MGQGQSALRARNPTCPRSLRPTLQWNELPLFARNGVLGGEVGVLTWQSKTRQTNTEP